MDTRLGLTARNIDTNFRLITNSLDNNKSLSDNLYYIIRNKKHFQQIYDVLGENKKYGYMRRHIENTNLERTVNILYKNIFRQPGVTQYDFTEWIKFRKETIMLVDPRYDFKGLTDILEVKISVNFQDNDENITIKCNNPNKLMCLLFELSKQLQIKTIRISNTENNSDVLNKLLYKIIEKLTS